MLVGAARLALVVALQGRRQPAGVGLSVAQAWVPPASSQADKVEFVLDPAASRREINKLHNRDGAAVWSDLAAVFSQQHLSWASTV